MRTLMAGMLAGVLVFAFCGCREKTTSEKLKDTMESAQKDAGKAIDSAKKDAKKAIDDLEK